MKLLNVTLNHLIIDTPLNFFLLALVAPVNPMNTQDEILTEVIDMLKKRGKPSSSSSTSSVTATHSSLSSSSSTSTANQGVDPIALARRVLDLDELNDYEGILNIATTKETRVSKNSPAALMRKAYLKLSLLIHPDKLGRTFDQATKAFQALVRYCDHDMYLHTYRQYIRLHVFILHTPNS